MAKRYTPKTIAELKDFITQEGNNRGQKKAFNLPKHIDELLSTFSADALVKVLLLLDDPLTPPGIKVKIWESISDRALGKISQGINITGQIDHKHHHNVILIPAQSTQTQDIIKLGTDGMPLLETKKPLQLNEEAAVIDAEYVENDSKD